MKRLINSSNFWNAVIASATLIVAFKFGIDNSILYIIGGLFGARTIATGMQDFVGKGNKEITSSIAEDSLPGGGIKPPKK